MINRIRSLTAVFILSGLLCGAQSKPAASHKIHPRIVCHGGYGNAADASYPSANSGSFDDWTLYGRADGSYTVNVESSDRRERHELSPDMKTKSVRWSDVPDDPKDLPDTFDCNYGPHEVTCRAEYGRDVTSAKLSHDQPYFVDGGLDELPMDFPWFYQMIVVQAMRSPGKPTTIAAIQAVAAPGGAFKLVAGHPARLEYLGQEKSRIRKQSLMAYKFRDVRETPEEDISTYWLSGSGLLLKFGNSNSTGVLTRFTGIGCNRLLQP